MSWGMCICSKCKREVHQSGTGWFHCEDKTDVCPGSEHPPYAQSLSEVRGKYCGMDGIPGKKAPWEK